MYRVTQWLKEVAAAEQEAKKHLAPAQFGERMKAMDVLAVEGRNMTDPQHFQEVMTIAHFTTYFGTALSRAFHSDYEYQGGQWQNYTYRDTTPDFRDVQRLRMTEPEGLERRREKAEAKATFISESYLQYNVDEFARQFDVSWQTIMNDDLGKIRETPRRMARAARRWLDAWVSNLYDNATTQATLIALGPPWSGTGRFTVPNLAIGITAMMQRVDANNNPMNLTNIYLVIPPVLQVQARTMLSDLLQYGGAASNLLGNYIAGIYVDPYIATAGINVPWYLFADPNEVPAVTVARMQGWPGPIVAMKKSDIQLIQGSAPAAFTMGSFATGDIEFVVEDVVGAWDDAGYVGVTDFRGLYYSNGTTP